MTYILFGLCVQVIINKRSFESFMCSQESKEQSYSPERCEHMHDVCKGEHKGQNGAQHQANCNEQHR